jgi:hypothetical protein
MRPVRIGITRLKGWQAFSADQRGAVGFEMVAVYPFLILCIMMPLADVAIAGFQFLSARQALRAFGQSIQYSPPTDLSNTSSWESAALAKADPNYPIDSGSFEVNCGDAGEACSETNTAVPRYYSYTTTITLSPLVLSYVLCEPSCTYTLSYSQRFF